MQCFAERKKRIDPSAHGIAIAIKGYNLGSKFPDFPIG